MQLCSKIKKNLKTRCIKIKRPLIEHKKTVRTIIYNPQNFGFLVKKIYFFLSSLNPERDLFS